MSEDNGRSRSDWHLRPPAPDELRDFAAPLVPAFGGISESELADWLKVAEPDRWLGAFEREDGTLVAGCASAFSLRLSVPGGELATAGVTGVGVRPDHRRRGILRALMVRQLADVHERGEPLAALWASESAIYQRFGYGLATLDGSFEVDTRRTTFRPGPEPEGRVRIVDEEESAVLFPRIYEAMRAVTPGAVSRSEPFWAVNVLADNEEARGRAGTKWRAVYELDGRPEGYTVYRVREDWDQVGPRGVLTVTDVVTTTPGSMRGLWRFLFDTDLVRTVKASRLPLPSPLQHVLLDPRALGLIAKDALWLRLVDLPAALTGRRYLTAGDLVLEVTDELCPWNAGRWWLRADGRACAAKASVERTDVPADLLLDTADLAAVYLGGVRPVELAEAGRIEERTAGAISRATAMFASERGPWCGTVF